VHDVNLRTTIVRTFQGQHVIIPNKDIFQNPLVNYSKTTSRRVDLRCGVAYGDDLQEAERVAVDAITKAGDVEDVELFYEEFGDSSINFVLRFWIHFEKQTDFLGARSRAIKQLKGAFDEHGITIPFPIRTLDFGVVGGEKLSEVLPQQFYAQS
jgi:small conductance mechanosensitive channel